MIKNTNNNKMSKNKSLLNNLNKHTNYLYLFMVQFQILKNLQDFCNFWIYLSRILDTNTFSIILHIVFTTTEGFRSPPRIFKSIRRCLLVGFSKAEQQTWQSILNCLTTKFDTYVTISSI